MPLNWLIWSQAENLSHKAFSLQYNCRHYIDCKTLSPSFVSELGFSNWRVRCQYAINTVPPPKAGTLKHQNCVLCVLLSFYNIIFHLLCTLTVPAAINPSKHFHATNTEYLVNYITVSVFCVEDLQVLHVEMLTSKSETKKSPPRTKSHAVFRCILY